MESAKLRWYNYDTEEYDCLDGMPKTDEEAKKYLPKEPTPAARKMYDLLRNENFKALSINDALIHVLSVCAGEKPPV